MSTRAADSFAEILANRDRIRKEAEPQCPFSPGRNLYDCLRSTARCGDACPNKNDWIGPEG